MYEIRKRGQALKHTYENKEVLSAPTRYVLDQQIKYKKANGYELKGEIKQQTNGYWSCLMVKQINLKGRA